MRIVGHGIDVVAVESVRTKMEVDDSPWERRVYSDQERASADAPPVRSRYYAGRFAGKEAVAKALGTGFSGDITWENIEILRRESGAPYVRLTKEALTLSERRGITEWHISISHLGPFVFASAIAVGR